MESADLRVQSADCLNLHSALSNLHSLHPPASPAEEVVDRLHGVEVRDPYRWLEADEAGDDRVQAWVAAQSAYARGMLDALPGHEALRERLASLLAIPNLGCPAVYGRRLFYQRRDGQQNQPLLYTREGDDGPERVLLDPNGFSQDGTVALDWFHPSRDGRLVAYGVSAGGDERSTLRVRDTLSGQDLPAVIPEARAASVAWLPDASGFYYTRYPAAGTVPAGEEQYHRRIFFHLLGTDPAADPEVFGAGREPSDWPDIQLSDDGRWLLASVAQGWAKTELYLREAAAPGPWVPVVEGGLAVTEGELAHGRLWLRTNLDAPNYRLCVADPAHPEVWQVVLPERADGTLQAFAVVREGIVALYLHRATSRLEFVDFPGQRRRALPLPGLGTVYGLGADHADTRLFVGFTSFATPPTVLRYDLPEGAPRPYLAVEGPPGLDRYVVEQVEYPSRDGTPITMFLVHGQEVRPGGNAPTVLTGYGGFNVARTPEFNRSLLQWLDDGGLWVLPNLRGGGEYGEAWHRAGMLGQKQNGFDDFLAAAEWLVDQGWTTPDRLAIWGGSNGGLLVGAALTQRPDLFRAVVCSVPLLDMVRYHHFRIARLWIPEYGCADDPEQFRWLYAYSPYHHLHPGVAYPAVLLTTGESDSRVDPMHARKMAAALQAATASDPAARPILLRVDRKAGHGQGKPLAKLVDELADVWAFLRWQLEVT
ncbi:MAG: S9 family peptidase [Chloroflexi bacterium]|nr:S9 family peptidase [Chloroflexota bacterium]